MALSLGDVSREWNSPEGIMPNNVIILQRLWGKKHHTCNVMHQVGEGKKSTKTRWAKDLDALIRCLQVCDNKLSLVTSGVEKMWNGSKVKSGCWKVWIYVIAQPDKQTTSRVYDVYRDFRLGVKKILWHYKTLALSAKSAIVKRAKLVWWCKATVLQGADTALSSCRVSVKVA